MNNPMKQIYSPILLLRLIIIVVIAFVHVSLSALLIFPILLILFGLNNANKFMDNMVINYISLFEEND